MRGPVARDRHGRRIGEFAYAVLAAPRDFSLIRLDPTVEASPPMAHFGGPTGINNDLRPDPVPIVFYGNGVGYGSVLRVVGIPTVPARSGFVLSLPDPDHAYANAPASPGDSGAGVNTADGRALGVLVAGALAFGGIGPDGIDAGTVVITRLGPQLARAAARTGIAFALVTAPIRSPRSVDRLVELNSPLQRHARTGPRGRISWPSARSTRTSHGWRSRHSQRRQLGIGSAGLVPAAVLLVGTGVWPPLRRR